MTSRQWLSRTAAAIALILCVNFAVAYVMDPYGVMRDTRGRELRVVFSARKAKYLLSKHYVPTNYDSLIIGPSSSENWDPTGIPGVKLYNESILGSNVFEEKRIVDQAMPNGHFKLALCILYPTMTSNHQMNDGLDAVSTAEAFGSIHLYVHEAVQLLAALHLPAGRLSAQASSAQLRYHPVRSLLLQPGSGRRQCLQPDGPRPQYPRSPHRLHHPTLVSTLPHPQRESSSRLQTIHAQAPAASAPRRLQRPRIQTVSYR